MFIKHILRMLIGLSIVGGFIGLVFFATTFPYIVSLITFSVGVIFGLCFCYLIGSLFITK